MRVAAAAVVLLLAASCSAKKHTVGDGFKELETAASYLGVPVSALQATVPEGKPTDLHWSSKIPASMWSPCSHTFCQMEKRKCSVNKHPSNGGIYSNGQSCPSQLTMRVFHNGRETAGRAHHCSVPSRQDYGKCECMCAHESLLDRLGDMFSGHTTAGESQCTHPSLWQKGMKCSGQEIPQKQMNAVLLADKYKENLRVGLGQMKPNPDEPQFCQYLCEDLGALCSRFNQKSGKCQCFDGEAQANSNWNPGFNVDAPCSKNPDAATTFDRKAAMHWYSLSRQYGSAYGKKRVEDLETFFRTGLASETTTSTSGQTTVTTCNSDQWLDGTTCKSCPVAAAGVQGYKCNGTTKTPYGWDGVQRRKKGAGTWSSVKQNKHCIDPTKSKPNRGRGAQIGGSHSRPSFTIAQAKTKCKNDETCAGIMDWNTNTNKRVWYKCTYKKSNPAESGANAPYIKTKKNRDMYVITRDNNVQCNKNSDCAGASQCKNNNQCETP